MFRAEHRQGLLDRTVTHRKRAQNTQATLAFMVAVGEDMVRINRDERLRPVGWTGRILRKWQVRKGPYKNATGPTLAPFGDDSRIIDWFAYQIKQTGLMVGNLFEMIAGWEDRGVHPRKGTIKILRHHAEGIWRKAGKTGGKERIVRDVLGTTPRMRKAYRDRFREFSARMFGPS
jgi:hypothetical protein